MAVHIIDSYPITLPDDNRISRSIPYPSEDYRWDLDRPVLMITSIADLMERSLLPAKKLNLSAYDACYSVLAQQLEIPLVTADQPLARKLDFAVFLDAGRQCIVESSEY